ncbi:NUDIX hydrolase [Terrabacter sp. NPDC000476]|uniref:NUDIX hydrolase n=1 Tax=Terrabacter sp. NPDC000476 TaxID=3154258 RepID=UPI0033249D8D
MSRPRRIATTEGASWLPPGSDAEVWVGPLDEPPMPTIIVRLLLVRAEGDGPSTFFTVPTPRGPDLPTRRLPDDSGREGVRDAVLRLTHEVLGRVGAAPRCVGFVRNVVRQPDAAYPHPTPWAHVPVFALDAAEAGGEPVVDGRWLDLDTARPAVAARHWWPIARHLIGGRDTAAGADEAQPPKSCVQ